MRLFPVLLITFAVACGDKSQDTGTLADIETTEDTEDTEETEDTETTQDTELTPEEMGKELYEANCAGCHGADAQGVSAPPIFNEVDEAFFDAIKNGKGYMPAFPELSDTDIGNIIAYIRSL